VGAWRIENGGERIGWVSEVEDKVNIALTDY